jgi:hypothetical protein
MKGNVRGQSEALFTVNSIGRKKHADKAAFKEKIQKAHATGQDYNDII